MSAASQQCSCGQPAKYTCPHCFRRLCSVACFQEHNRRACLEAFAQEQVTGELRARRPREGEARAMIEILERARGDETIGTEEFVEVDEDGSGAEVNAVPPLSELLRGLVIEPWRPWWMSAGIEEAKGRDETDQVQLARVSELTASAPKPALVFSIVEVLYAYVLVIRLWNGDRRSDPRASFQDVLGIAASLTSRTPPSCTTLQQALSSAQERAVHPPVAVESVAARLALRDLALVWKFTSAIHRALTELHTWSIHAAKQPAEEQQQKKKDRKFAAKKLYFFRCWAQETLVLGAPVHEQIGTEINVMST